jgi:DNA-binding MarR family transcriptional regulator
MRSRAQARLAEIDLHPGQELLLLRLSATDGVTQSELADELCVQPPTVTKMLDRLEKAGSVVRKPDPEDQRVSRVYLTGAGRALQGPIHDTWRRLEEEGFANLTLDERVLLRRLLMQVYENLNR